MAERRSLGDAIITPISPEKLAFIKSGETKPAAEPPTVKDVVFAETVLSEPKSAEKRTRSSRRSSRDEQEPEPTDVLDELLVSRTVRFQYRTAQALTRAHLERKLKKLRPSTQQEIIEIAVQDWLKDHGYLS